MKTTVLALILGTITMSPALACSNPGTPNPVFAFATGANTIQLKITNTATEGSEHTIWFLAQQPAGSVQRYTQGRILDGDFAVFTETNLQPGKPYCFRIWTRVDTIDGCESKQPSGYVCATTQPPYAPTLTVSNNAKEDPSSKPPIPGLPPNVGQCIANGTGNVSAQMFSTKDGQKCCTNPEGSCDNLCCHTTLVCPSNMHRYCSATN